MNDCEKVREHLSAYIDDMLNDTEKEEILTHLASCSLCRGEYELLKSISETAKDLPELSVSPALHQSIMDKVMQEAERPKTAKFSFRKQGLKIASLAAVLIISLVSLQNLPEHPESTPNVLTEEKQKVSDVDRAAVYEESSDAIEQEEALNNRKADPTTVTKEPIDTAMYRDESVNGVFQKDVPKMEDSFSVSAPIIEEASPAPLPVATVTPEPTRTPHPTKRPSYDGQSASGAAGGGTSAVAIKVVEYTFTESGYQEAKQLLAQYPQRAGGYGVRCDEYETLHQKLSALPGFVKNTEVSVSESDTEVYVRLFTE